MIFSLCVLTLTVKIGTVNDDLVRLCSLNIMLKILLRIIPFKLLSPDLHY